MHGESIQKTLSQRNSGSRFYVWIVTGCTLLLVALLIWPMSVDRFKSNVTFQLRFDPASHVSKSEINQLIIDEIYRQTRRDQLRVLLATVTNPTSPLVVAADARKVREAIRIQSRPGNVGNTLWFRVSLLGRGSADEVQLVNALVSRVTSNIGSSMLRRSANEAIDRFANDIQHHQQSWADQYSMLVDNAVTGLAAAGNELDVVINNLDGFDVSKRSNSRESTADTPVDPIQQQIQSLQAERRRQLELPGVNEFHPSVTGIQLEIEALQNKAGGTNPTPTEPGLVRDGAQRVTNRFVANRAETAINREFFDSALQQVVAEMRMIDLQSPRQKLNQLRQSIDQHAADQGLLIDRMGSRAKQQLTGASPISFDRVQIAKRSKPIGGVPTLGQFMLLTVFAGLAAAAVAWNYDPAVRKRRFRSVHQIQTRLRVPVVGSLRARPINLRPKSIKTQAASLIVTVCEWTLLVMLIVLIVAAAVNSEVITALMENPFEAASKTFWIMFPRG